MHPGRRLICALAALLILLSSHRVVAAEEDKSVEAKRQRAHVALMEKVLPEVNFDNVAIDDAIDFLRDVSGLQAVIVRDPGVPEGQPMLKMRLKSVPLEQLLQVLCTAHPEIGIEAVETSDGPNIQVIRIRATEQTGAAANEGPKVVRVYPLNNEIMLVLRARGEATNTGADKDALKKGLDHVLSLIKVVVEAAGDRAAPTLAVHEETQSLIVTGTPQQQARVQDTLAALRGERPQEAQQNNLERLEQRWRKQKAADDEQMEKLHRDAERLNIELQEMRKAVHEAQDQARGQAIEAERMRVRLEEAMSRGQASPQNAAPLTERPSATEGGSSKPSAK
jgi:hypothetical protein